METRCGDKDEARLHNESRVPALETEGTDVTVECECGQAGCIERLVVGARMYRKVRRQPAWYLLAAGHEVAAKERVVLRQPDFVVVDESWSSNGHSDAYQQSDDLRRGRGSRS